MKTLSRLAASAAFSVAGLTAGIGVIAATGGVASAASDNHINAGVPGTPSCAGQSLAFVAQGNFYAPGPVGIGNVASFFGVPVSQVHSTIQYYCATGIIP